MVKPCECRKQKEMERRIQFATIPKIYEDATLKNFTLSAYKTQLGRQTMMAAGKSIKEYMDSIEDALSTGLGLYIFSETKGSGKTRMLASIANGLLDNHSVKFITSNQILNEIRETYDKNTGKTESEFLNRLCMIDVLFLDDFGAEKITGWVNDRLYSIINERYVNQRATFFSSNAPIEQLEYDGRIKSRIQEMTYQIPFPEESVRANIAYERNSKMRGE